MFGLHGAVTEILACVHYIAERRPYISPAMSQHMITANRQRSTHDSVDSLTSAERRVLALVAQGKSSKAIAQTLSISTKTVDNHRSNICTKLNLHGTNALFRYALEHRSLLVDPG